MTKIFLTDTDIEELFQSGVRTLAMTDEVVLTDLAYEKARKLGLLVDEAPPGAPVRPYLSEVNPRQTTGRVDSVTSAAFAPPALTPSPSPREALREGAKGHRGAELEKRIREKVAAKLGTQVDPQLLDAIIKRTLKVTGMK